MMFVSLFIIELPKRVSKTGEGDGEYYVALRFPVQQSRKRELYCHDVLYFTTILRVKQAILAILVICIKGIDLQ